MQYICTDNYTQIMENIIKSLKIRCVEAGTNLNEACREAGVIRQTVERWSKNPPKTLQTLDKLERAIERLKAKNTESNA
jgi:hypothetical protein